MTQVASHKAKPSNRFRTVNAAQRTAAEYLCPIGADIPHPPRRGGVAAESGANAEKRTAAGVQNPMFQRKFVGRRLILPKPVIKF